MDSRTGRAGLARPQTRPRPPPPRPAPRPEAGPEPRTPRPRPHGGEIARAGVSQPLRLEHEWRSRLEERLADDEAAALRDFDNDELGHQGAPRRRYIPGSVPR